MIKSFDFLCPACGEMGFESDTHGMCHPCECDMHIKERDEKVAKELLKYERRIGLKYTENEFIDLCMDRKIDRGTLDRLPLLRDDYDWCMACLAENESDVDMQLDLFQQNDLPF